ncbi:MAG: ABC transporter permease [Planctomycetota bacterium]|nr:ABC transporter permease [Planctomycetota bacterium]
MNLRGLLNAVNLAWRHLAFHGVRSSILVLALGISAALPLVIQSLIERGETATMARADRTPLVVGAPGGGIDLVLGALWFLPEPLGSIPSRTVREITDSGLADALPLSLSARAGGAPVVGTDVGYLDFRDLRIAEGRSFAVPGECVLGADLAAKRGLGPGDTILTDPEGLLDIGGGYPLRLRITGVLAPARSPDDGAVFCDLRTSWIIAGHGHVHIDLEEVKDEPEVLMGTSEEGRSIASAAITPYTELTPERLETLHFHGNPEDLPIEGLVVVPRDAKSSTILSARLERRGEIQLARPSVVIAEVLERVFKIGALLAGILVATGVATLAVVALVLALSIRLRRDELDTLSRIGAGRATIATLLLSEVVILAGGAALFALLVLACSFSLPDDLVLRLAN